MPSGTQRRPLPCHKALALACGRKPLTSHTNGRIDIITKLVRLKDGTTGSQGYTIVSSIYRRPRLNQLRHRGRACSRRNVDWHARSRKSC